MFGVPGASFTVLNMLPSAGEANAAAVAKAEQRNNAAAVANSGGGGRGGKKGGGVAAIGAAGARLDGGGYRSLRTKGSWRRGRNAGGSHLYPASFRTNPMYTLSMSSGVVVSGSGVLTNAPGIASKVDTPVSMYVTLTRTSSARGDKGREGGATESSVYLYILGGCFQFGPLQVRGLVSALSLSLSLFISLFFSLSLSLALSLSRSLSVRLLNCLPRSNY